MKLIEMFPNPIDGIFTKLAELFPDAYPWADEYIDVMYLSHSGNKTASPLVDRVLENSLPSSFGTPIEQLCSIINKCYGKQWARMYEVFETEYNALSNYIMRETETPDITHETNASGEGNSAANVFGFNSINAVPQANSNASTEQNTTTTEKGTRKYDREGLSGEAPQQALERELQFRKQSFYNSIFESLDRLLTCPLYE